MGVVAAVEAVVGGVCVGVASRRGVPSGGWLALER